MVREAAHSRVTARRLHALGTGAILVGVIPLFRWYAFESTLTPALAASALIWLTCAAYFLSWFLPQDRPWNRIAYGKLQTLDEYQVQLRHRALHKAYWSVAVLACSGLFGALLGQGKDVDQLQRLAYLVVVATFTLPGLFVAWLLPNEGDL